MYYYHITINNIEYRSIQAACNAYGTPYSRYKDRIKRDWSRIDAITIPAQGKYRRPIKDHKGRTFPSIRAAARYYNLTEENLRYRLREYKHQKANWRTLKKVFTTPAKSPKR